MKRAGRLLAAAVAVLLVGAGTFVLSARAGWLVPSDSTLRARYGLPQSQFPLIDGRQVHLVDEGQGPTILLVHGSFASLREWDDWAKALTPHYRVVRFDLPGMGLTGPSPDHRYDREEEIHLIGAVVDALHLGPVVLVATSSGGNAAAGWAAHNPDKLAGVILANIAAGPLPHDRPDDRPLTFRLVTDVLPLLGGWQPRLLWREALEYNFAEPARVTPQMVRRWTDLANRTQKWPRVPLPKGHVYFSQAPADLAAIHVPTLLLWSANDRETTLDGQGRKALRLLGSANKQLVVVPDCGHIMPLECGARSVAAAMPFIARVTAARSALAVDNQRRPQ